jgi:oxygen-independent coproporphyrinogen-3 oxidase
MDQIARLRALGLFDARVPRYTSYPTAPVFSPAVGAAFQAEALASLDPAEPVSVYVHIPFCERLCWFCACHTQGTQTLSPVEEYLATLEREIGHMAALLPAGTAWAGSTGAAAHPRSFRRRSSAGWPARSRLRSRKRRLGVLGRDRPDHGGPYQDRCPGHRRL